MSMEQILDKARELGGMLAESVAFSQMIALEQAAMESSAIADLYAECTDLQEQAEAMSLEEGSEAEQDDLRRDLEEAEARLSSHPEIKALESARTDFNDLMAQVNRALQAALQGEEGSGCGPEGCAGCQGCGAR